MPDSDFFADDYFAARAVFLAHASHGERLSHTMAVKGPSGEALTIDALYIGDAAPRRLLLLSSGVHGVEGYAGSALQALWLREFAARRPADTGVLLVHAVNPYGFAHGRRVNEHNVDLNRNSLADFPGPANPAYRRLNRWLNPTTPVPRMDDFLWRGLPLLLRYGRASLTQAVAAGQYEFPQGLFYGGARREESIAILEDWWSRPHLRAVQQVWHLDLHTGLGAYGGYQLLLEEPIGSPTFAACARAFGADCVKSDHPANVTHYSAHGVLSLLTQRAFTGARIIAGTLEFGTLRPGDMLRILCAENRLYHCGARNPAEAAHARAALVEAFAPRDERWRDAVIAGGREVFGRLHAMLGQGD